MSHRRSTHLHPSAARRPRGRRALAAGGATAALALPLAALAAGPAGAQDAETDIDLALAMSGEWSDVVAVAETSGDALNVDITVTNSTGRDVELVVPFGAMLATAQVEEQTIVLGGPVDAEAVSYDARTQAVVVGPGETTIEFAGLCGQEEDGAPYGDLSYRGVALAPLPTVLANIHAAGVDPSDWDDDALDAQDAVWWVTDRATLPVDPDVEPFLEGVDVEAFAADPVEVVPDDAYDSGLERDGDGDGDGDGEERAVGDLGAGSDGPSAAPLWVLAGLAAVGATVMVVRRPAPARAPSAPVRPVGTVERPVPGWYADPSGRARARWWDGAGWTDHTT